MRALLLLLFLSDVFCTPRAVVTFLRPDLNNASLVPDNVTIVKQYGRRLVVHLGRDLSTDDTNWLASSLGGDSVVQVVEPDSLVGFADVDDVVAFDFPDVFAANKEAPDTTADAFEFDTTTDEDVHAADATSSQNTSIPWHLSDSEPYGLHIQSLRQLTNGSDATIAILDSGLAQAGIERWRPAGGFDFISSSDYSNDQTGRDTNFADPGDAGPTCPKSSWHGTRIVSVVDQIAPAATLVIIRILGRCGAGFANDVTDAIVWAAGGAINGVAPNANPARIISMSFNGAGACPSYMQSAVNQALGLGAVLVAAAGNQASDAGNYFPGNCAGVIAVGASTRQGTLAAYSNFGPSVDLNAPGGDTANPISTLSVLNGALTPYFSTGTSFAAPHVTGLLGLLSLEQVAYLISNLTISTCSNMLLLNCKVTALMATTMNHTPQTIPRPVRVDQLPSDATYPMVTGQTCYWYPVGNLVCTTAGTYISCTDPYPSCPSCPEGTYSGGSVDACVSCWPGKYAPGSGNTGCATCNPGSYASSYGMGTCRSCDANTYNTDAGSLSCYPCPAGMVSGTGATACVCRAGTFTNGYSCESCTPGYFCRGDNTRTKCPVGQIAVGSGNTVCSPCAAGTFNNYEGNSGPSCAGCGGGTYSGSGASSCSSCGIGSYSGTNAASCTLASPGYYVTYAGSVIQRACSPGYWGTESGQSACKICDAGTISAANAAQRCSSCGPGTVAASAGLSVCTSCAIGTFGMNTNGATYCPYSCPTGTWGQAAGKTSQSDACANCPAGTWGNAAAGQTSQQNACNQQCKSGFWSNSIARVVECTDTCLPGTYGSGAAKSSDSSGCTNCPSGTWNPDTASAGASACKQCATGTASTASGAYSPTTCVSCAAGSYSSTQQASSCTQCGKGTFSAALGATSSGTCTWCAVGSYNLQLGASVCTLCLPGYYMGTQGNGADSRENGCKHCTTGTYFTPFAGASECSTCNNNKLCTVAGEREQPCTDTTDKMCVSCPLIARCTYKSSLCEKADKSPACLCDAGYEIAKQADGAYKCVSCGNGFFRLADETSNACARWTVQNCISGLFAVDGTAVMDSECLACPVPRPENTWLMVATPNKCTWACVQGYENAV